MPGTITVPVKLKVTASEVTINVPGNTLVPQGDQTIRWVLTGGNFAATNPIDFGTKGPDPGDRGKKPKRDSATGCSISYKNTVTEFDSCKYTVTIELGGVTYVIDPEMTNQPPMP